MFNLKLKIKPILIFLLIVLITFNYLYFEYKSQKRSVRLTPEMIEDMSKEELKGYIELKEKLNKNNFYLDVIFIIFNFFLGFYLGYILFYKKQNKEKEDILKYLELLPEKEKMILKFIINKGGKTTQYQIWKNLELSKVETSRLIKKLEENGKIIVDRSGKVNYIELSDDLKKLFL